MRIQTDFIYLSVIGTVSQQWRDSEILLLPSLFKNKVTLVWEGKKCHCQRSFLIAVEPSPQQRWHKRALVAEANNFCLVGKVILNIHHIFVS